MISVKYRVNHVPLTVKDIQRDAEFIHARVIDRERQGVVIVKTQAPGSKIRPCACWAVDVCCVGVCNDSHIHLTCFVTYKLAGKCIL